MKRSRPLLPILATVCFLLFPVLAGAQDADKQKLIDIEKALAAAPNPGSQAAQLVKQYLYDGNVTQLNGVGRVGTLPKARVLELSAKPDPADSAVKTTLTLSDFHVEIYGDTALVSYKQIDTDTGHKDAALNATDHLGCLDTFVKRSGQWYVVGTACALSAPMAKSEWDAIGKVVLQEPKDVQEAYH
jgi:hypothetical protein